MNVRSSRHILFALSVAALVGCTSQPARTPAVDTGTLEARAAQAGQAGNTEAAVGIYRQLADASRGETKARFLIEAARLLLGAEDWSRAQLWLEEARLDATPEQTRSILVLLARAEVGLGQPDRALAALADLRPPFSVALSRDIAEVRALALFALGQVAEAVRTLVDREIWLDSAAEISANQRLIWDGLAANARAAPPPRTGDPTVDGWLALIPLTTLTSDQAAFRRALIEWRRQFVAHPAARGILAELVAGQRESGTGPARIALLLPLGSVRRTQVLAVRDGFLAAHLTSGHKDISIAVYDTALRGSADAYLAAQLDGADFIVGPLFRDEVAEIIDQAGFIPTLALNFAQIDAQFPPSFYQFALSPEDEARAIAERAIASGQTRALALFASDDRGYGLMNAFRDAFEALGGQVLNSAAYVPESQNFSQPVEELLNRSRSEQRHRRLQANLGRPVEFEPRRRQDVDMIFLQVDRAPIGRLLAPQLRFDDAGDIPTYSTSDIYDTARQGTDSDLNGVIFPDLPLLLEPEGLADNLTRELDAYWPERGRQWVRLYAFGYDAYRLVDQLYSTFPSTWPMRGITGDLYLDVDGRIHRGLPFAQFQNGRPVTVPTLPVPTPPFPESSPASDDVFGAR